MQPLIGYCLMHMYTHMHVHMFIIYNWKQNYKGQESIIHGWKYMLIIDHIVYMCLQKQAYNYMPNLISNLASLTLMYIVCILKYVNKNFMRVYKYALGSMQIMIITL